MFLIDYVRELWQQRNVCRCHAEFGRLTETIRALEEQNADYYRATVLLIAALEEDLSGKLNRILAAVEPLPADKITFDVELEGQTFQGANSITMTDSQQATVTPKITDVRGNPAPVQGVPVWASSDETIVTVTPAEDGLSAVVKATGPLGTASVTMTADADLGEGVKPIFGKLDVEITAGQATGITLTLGEATEQ